MNDKLKIKGLGVINPCPYTASDEINEEEYRKHINWMADNGLNFIQPLAATGQALSMTKDEFKKVYRWTVEELKGKVLITGYTGRADTKETIEYTKMAQDLGCDCVFIMEPYFSRPSPRGLYEHFKAIAEAVPGFPIVFYNNPVRGGDYKIGSPIVIPLDVMDRLVNEYDNFVGLKEGQLDMLAEHCRVLRDRIDVFPWDERQWIYGLAFGCPAVLTYSMSIIPKQMSDLLRTWQKGEKEKATELYFKYLPLFNLIHIEANPGPLGYMLKRLGWNFGPRRLPIVPPAPETVKIIDGVLDSLGLI